MKITQVIRIVVVIIMLLVIILILLDVTGVVMLSKYQRSAMYLIQAIAFIFLYFNDKKLKK